jgi:hypothetical protein
VLIATLFGRQFAFDRRYSPQAFRLLGSVRGNGRLNCKLTQSNQAGVVDRGGFEPPYARAGRFTVCCH